MERKENPIYDRYRNMILDAFISLTKIMPYDEITILRIAQEADVSRQTFYRHFKSKEDIVTELLENISKEVNKRLQELTTPTRKEIFTTYLSFWALHKDFLHIVNSGHIESRLISFYEDVMQEQLDILRPHFPDLSDDEFALIKTFLIGGLFQLKSNWCKQEFNKSADELAELLDSILAK